MLTISKRFKLYMVNMRYRLARLWGSATRTQRVRFFVWTLVGLYSLAVFVFLLVFWLEPYLNSLRQVTVGYFRNPAAEQPVPEGMRWLDGLAVATSSVNPPLVAAVIENHVDARPPFGLADARVVYEAPVEGNITRFLALYPLEETPERIGPVRSVRPYYAHWALEWGSPLLAHVGGSQDGLAVIRSNGMNDFDEYAHGRFFWRDNTKERPHNVFTSGELLSASLQATSSEFLPWRFEVPPAPGSGSEQVNSSTPEGSALRVTYSAPWYDVQWSYDSADDVYYRLQAGQLHRDNNGKKMSASNVIVQRVDADVIDDAGRLAIEVNGKGEASIFMHGRYINGSWSRNAQSKRTRFFDAQGEEIALAPGQVWVQVLAPWHAFNAGAPGVVAE